MHSGKFPGALLGRISEVHLDGILEKSGRNFKKNIERNFWKHSGKRPTNSGIFFFLEELQVTSFVKFMKRSMLELQMKSQEKHEGVLVHTSVNSERNFKKIHIFGAFLRGIPEDIPKEISKRYAE